MRRRGMKVAAQQVSVKVSLVVMFVLACAACGAARPAPKPFVWATSVRANNPLVGKAFDARTRELVSPARAESAALDVPFVLLGEKHDNPDHHRLQARALEAIVDHGRRPAVVFEMIDLDLQPALDAFLATGSSDLDQLSKVLEWDKRGWPAWSIYRPIFEVALAARLKMVAAGLDRETVRRIVREGTSALPPDIAPRARPIPLEPALAASLEAEIKESHCGMLPDAMLAPMSLAQRVKDALMASLMVSNATKDGAVLVAGNGHVRVDRGVPHALTGRAITISFVEVTASSDAAGYEKDQPASFIVFTPRLDDEDPCAKFHP